MDTARSLRLTLVVIAAVGGAASRLPAVEATATPTFEPAAIEFFEKRVRPVLVARCYECHGQGEAKGGLSLDAREAIIAGGDTGAAIVPGKPEESLLVDAIRYGDVYQMPPKSQLPADEIDALAEWVKLGAPWPAGDAATGAKKEGGFDFAARAKHWCFQPLAESPTPEVRNTTWPTTALDRYILAELEKAGLDPAPPADKRTWLRRVTYDLVGLPATRGEIAAFLADDSPRAYEAVVDRLLASPHYGERWARHWLDLARYAETYGHEFDFDIPNAYRYRDYVIRALNADVPYDQFIVEHLAGDLLERPRVNQSERINESILGTGFWWLGEATHSPVDVRQDEANRVDNQIDVFAKTFLAMTVSCARCHDHKFDAILTKDYYALAGYLQSSRLQQAFIDLPEVFAPHLNALESLRARESDALAALQAASADRAETIAGRLADVASADDAVRAAGENAADPLHAFAALYGKARSLPPEQFATERAKLIEGWNAEAARAALPADAKVFVDFGKDDFSGWYATGQAFGDRPARAGGRVATKSGQALAAAGAAHSGRLSTRLQGALRSPTFTIESPTILYKLYGTGGRLRLIVDGLQLIQNPIYGGLQFSPDRETPYWHTQDVSKWIGHRAYLELIDGDNGYLALERLAFSAAPVTGAGGSNVALAGALSDPELTGAAQLRDRLQGVLGDAFKRWSNARDALTPDDWRLVDWSLARLSALGDLDPAIAGPLAILSDVAGERSRREAELPQPRLGLAMADGTGENERVFIRGNHKNLGEEVPRRNMVVLAGADQPAPAAGSGRLELARRLVDASNPLVPRVIVNRIWKHHFGEGLVPTPDDFGVMGQSPRNAALLDHLALEFVREGWSIKRLHKQIALSSAYRMSSARGERGDAIDPQNALLHRMPVRRLEAETIRDAMLAVSGRLDRTLYGPGVPPHLTEFMVGRGRPAQSGPLDGAGRRSVYLGVRRNFLAPLLTAFDYPTPFTTIGRRTVSNVPAQALALLNNPFVAEQSALWAKAVLGQNHPTPQARITAMYETALGRLPEPDELSTAEAFLTAAQVGRGDSPDGEAQALAELAQVLFNLKEFIFVF